MSEVSWQPSGRVAIRAQTCKWTVLPELLQLNQFSRNLFMSQRYHKNCLRFPTVTVMWLTVESGGLPTFSFLTSLSLFLDPLGGPLKCLALRLLKCYTFASWLLRPFLFTPAVSRRITRPGPAGGPVPSVTITSLPGRVARADNKTTGHPASAS